MLVNPNNFLWPEKEKLVHHIISIHGNAFAWDKSEKGKFSDKYFNPVVIPTIKHIPWVLCNIPISFGIFNQIVEVIKNKIALGIYELSNSSYWSQWFCILKKDRKSLCIVHDLQPLNTVSIKDSVLSPMVEQYAKAFSRQGCYTIFDLFVGFD